MQMRLRVLVASFFLGTVLLSNAGCSYYVLKPMEVTAYCGCGECAGWERGSWAYLKLDFWNRYINYGPHKGREYSGRTASGTWPHEPRPGLLSVDTVVHPWMLPVRLIFPWLWLPRDGTIAADTRYYPFRTRIFVRGYGYGRVEDRGGAIKGPQRLDLYFRSHGRARQWGRQRIKVEVFE